jgi:hypothetical protein
MRFWKCVFGEVHHSYTNLKDLVLAWEETLESLSEGILEFEGTKWPNF